MDGRLGVAVTAAGVGVGTGAGFFNLGGYMINDHATTSDSNYGWEGENFCQYQ